MAAHVLFCTLLLILLFMLPNQSTSDKLLEKQRPQMSFVPDNWKTNYRAGETGAFVARIYEGFRSKQDEQAFNPIVQVNEVVGNSSLVTGLWFDRNNWKIHFIPVMVGMFNVFIDDNRFNVHSYGNSYHVTPGPIYEPGGVVSWKDQVNDVVAGTKVAVLILPKDAFGNNVTSESEGQNIYNFDVSATTSNGSNVNLLDISNKGWNENGYVCIEFVVVTAGHLSVHIKHKNSSLIGSPLPLTVHPEALDVGNCVAYWGTETQSFQLLSRMETFINQRDKFGNLVPGLYEFNLQVMEDGYWLPIPISDLQYKEVSPGIQLWSFTVVKPGEFMLIITDNHHNYIRSMPLEFSIYTGYCDDAHSSVYGPGLYDSIAGLEARFSISLKDAYQYPSPVELQRVLVQIILPSLSIRVYPQIHYKKFVNGTHPTGMLGYGAFGPTGMTYDPSDLSHDDSIVKPKKRSSEFDVTYVPEKTGIYEIRIFCGNIPLNRGHPFIKRVHAAEVNMSTSGVIKFDKRASAGIINNVFVQLLDSFYNPVLYEEQRLKLDIHSKSGNRAFACLFEDLHNGTYEGSYYAYHPGEYELCISYHGQRFSPWPFGIETLDPKEFPSVRDDTVNVWEDQSVPIDVLENDINFDGKKTISEFQRPSHGSVVQYGDLLRYTPYKGFYGHDKFAYTMVNAHGNMGTAEVTVHVLCMPPQFVSYPKELHADEDTLTPQFGGFPGFEVMYSDPQDNISVILTAENGTVFLSPLLMQLWDPMWIGFSVSKQEGGDELLNITGHLGAINFALKSLQYLGKANYSGVDHIDFATININGQCNLSVLVIVEPVNDPPVINVPKFIILENMKENEGFLIFARQQNKFNFSIGDPDHSHIRDISNLHLVKLWNETYFRVMFSVEVSSGTFAAKLPAQLISTTEVKVKRSKQWQPLQTYVEISKHFTVNKVSGIRFLGTLNDCNTLLQHLVYYGDKHDGVFRLRVNDMGWHGCYPDCSHMMSTPLMSEATIHLMRRAPMNSLVAHSLGLVIMIESVVLSALAVILMFFTCKCVIILAREKKKQQAESLNVGSPENAIQLTENHPSPFSQSEQPSDLPKPAEETNVAEVATMIL